jgi:hypothetical protein
MKKKVNFLIPFMILLSVMGLMAQEKTDTIATGNKKKKEKPVVQTPYHWNTIKFNPTPMLIQAIEIRNMTFSYERLINKKMSVSVQAGYLDFPRLTTDTILNLIHINKGNKKGINLAFDYRYYPFQRNRRPAPDGLYIGTYLSYYGFQFKNTFDIVDTSVVQNGTINGKLNVVNLGVELGYQFIFWKRFSVDLLLFGPSISYHSGSLSIGGNLNPDKIQEIDGELAQRLMDRFPLIKSLVSGEDLRFTGSNTRFGTGFRYSIQLGFHF